MGPDKTTDVKAEGNSRGWEKHNFIVKHQCWLSALRRSSLMADLTCSSTERFVLCSSAHVTTCADFGNLGFRILYLNKAEETPPGTDTSQVHTVSLLFAKCFSSCNTTCLCWHLLPSSAELLTDPQRFQLFHWEEHSLMLTEGKGETEKEIARKMRKRFFWFPFFP